MKLVRLSKNHFSKLWKNWGWESFQIKNKILTELIYSILKQKEY